MFYTNEGIFCRATVVLTPVESKRLIAKCVVNLPEVRKALKEGIIIVAGGTTNGYIVREITGEDIDVQKYTAGRIFEGKLDTTDKSERIKPFVLLKGIKQNIPVQEILEEFTQDDVFIKGANAIDSWGNAAILAANPMGGTLGRSWGTVVSRGAHLICPAGLEKLIPSVKDAVASAGQLKFKYNMGKAVGVLELSGARVITEIQAMQILYELEAVHIASGGVMGSEGSVVLAVAGEKKKIEEMWNEIEAIKNLKNY